MAGLRQLVVGKVVRSSCRAVKLRWKRGRTAFRRFGGLGQMVEGDFVAACG